MLIVIVVLLAACTLMYGQNSEPGGEPLIIENQTNVYVNTDQATTAAPVEKREKKDRARSFTFLNAGLNSTQLVQSGEGSRADTEPAGGWQVGIDAAWGRVVYAGIGAYYYRYGTGSELLQYTPAGVLDEDPSHYFSGFKTRFLLGAKVGDPKLFGIGAHAGLNLYPSPARNGELTGIGDLAIEGPVWAWSADVWLNLNVLSASLGIERGVTPWLVGSGNEYQMNMAHASVGLRF